jgi:alkylation response protein AidB-like acyl-CoA dehydrogenase
MEFATARVPRVTRGLAEALVAPAIIVHGTSEQKSYFLPRILTGEDRYCQGFSEPDAGSDLAGLRTRGVVDGNEVLVTGQKVWTSDSAAANMVFVLCRTDLDAPKHRGISYVLMPLRDNNIDIVPLRQLNGGADFAQVFFNGARAPLFNVIGGLNNGWRVAMTTLGNERGGAAVGHLGFEQQFWRLVELARGNGRAADPLVRQRLAWSYERIDIMRFSAMRMLASMADGRDPGPTGSLSKLFSSEFNRKFMELALQVLGAEATTPEEGSSAGFWYEAFLVSRAMTIAGGASEIQRNILGERVLGLPKDPQGPANAG